MKSFRFDEKDRETFTLLRLVAFVEALMKLFLPAVSNKWIHERGQEFRRRCSLDETD